MAGEQEKLSGLSKHFNGTTMAGRTNVAKALLIAQEEVDYKFEVSSSFEFQAMPNKHWSDIEIYR